jgi:hypothetical protein
MTDDANTAPGLFDDPPPADYDGPGDPSEFVFIDPDEHRPWTVILASNDAMVHGGSVQAGIAIVNIHAPSPTEAARLAAADLNRRVTNGQWRYATAVFVTEGYHTDMRPNSGLYTI